MDGRRWLVVLVGVLMGVSGDFARLSRLTAALGALADGTARRALLRTAAPIVASLVDEGFVRQQAPRGRAWKPLKRPRATGRGILDDTGLLRSQATRVVATDFWLTIFVTREGAASHLYGAPGANIPARPYLPLGSLPSAWTQRLNTAASSVLATLLA